MGWPGPALLLLLVLLQLQKCELVYNCLSQALLRSSKIY